MSEKNWLRYERYRQINREKIIPALHELKEVGQDLRMEQCGDIIRVAKCVGCGAMHYLGHTLCRGRWCMNCMHKKLLCWLKRLLLIFQDWYIDGNYLSALNFTVRDAMPLLDPLERLENAYRVVYNGRGNREKWKERFPGGIRTLEVKIGKDSGMWHPHYHTLVMQRGDAYEKDYDWLSEAWHETVGCKIENGEPKIVMKEDGTLDKDWNGNVWIKKVSENKKNGILEAVCETLKYILKPDKRYSEKKTAES